MTIADSSPTVQEIDVRTKAALDLMRERALDAYPDEHGRISRGHMLATMGYVTLHDDGTASVLSQSLPDTVFHVNGFCPCRDYTFAPGGRCKHRYARVLMAKAYTHIHQKVDESLESDVIPYHFPQWTRYQATYQGPLPQWQHANGIATLLTVNRFSFLPEGHEVGLECAYTDLALGPGLE